MKILDWAGALFRWLAGAVVPMFARPVPPVGLAWFLHVLLVAGLAVGAYYLELYAGWRDKIGYGPHWFKPFWASALFLLAYALLWSAAWLWQLLAPNQPTTDFPDLDAAWAEAVAALEKAGIGIADTPLFLVFGTLPEGFDPLFRALPHGLVVSGGTAPTAPLRVFANRDSIFLTLPGATLLGFQDLVGSSAAFETGDGGGSVYGTIGAAGESVGIGASVGASIGAGFGASIGGASIGGGSIGGSVGAAGPLQEIQRIIREAREQNRPLSEAEKQRVRDLSGGVPAGGGGGGGRAPSAAPTGSVLQNPRVVDEAAARLAHVCGLVAAARWPLCPVNGAVVTVPMAATDKDEAAQQWGLVARQDLAVAGTALKLHFPVYVLVGGAEDLPGGKVFFERFAADKGGQRLGKGFPLNPELRPTDVAAAVESSVNWVFGSLLPYWAFKLTRVGDADARADSRDNAQLVRFLAEVRRRGPHLARLVSRAVQSDGEQVPVFGGTYLTVVLDADPNEAKFAKEFFRKVESSQGYVAWTDEAFAEDASYRRATLLGHLALAGLLLAVAALATYVGYDTLYAKK
jgi:hypothetical protein